MCVRPSSTIAPTPFTLGTFTTPHIRKKIDIESPPITLLYKNYIFFCPQYFNTNLISVYSTPHVTQEYAVTFYS